MFVQCEDALNFQVLFIHIVGKTIPIQKTTAENAKRSIPLFTLDCLLFASLTGQKSSILNNVIKSIGL